MGTKKDKVYIHRRALRFDFRGEIFGRFGRLAVVEEHLEVLHFRGRRPLDAGVPLLTGPIISSASGKGLDPTPCDDKNRRVLATGGNG